ncbi:hypothetical protein IB233_21355 [Comamonas sp. CMM01]|uniref:hypothetical protein n=1 Tax=Comamonas sp. CMM01 TaxID=2769280 RepID=UPI001781D134|nr:hypothetical protein [Comamonas sp. CMM01]MBD9534175.1 hypothetical protein [Comamonas sp. CMM01]
MEYSGLPITVTPCLRSQHLPVRPDPNFPYLGRDPMDRGCAVFAIVQAMYVLGLASKTSTLLQWLGRFEGLEQHLEEYQDPVQCVRQVLLQFRAALPALSAARNGDWPMIVSSILSLEFVHMHSAWSRGEGAKPRIYWNPLHQNWLSFLEEGQEGETVATWKPADGNPMLAAGSATALLMGLV